MEVPRQPIYVKCGMITGANAIKDWDQPIYHYVRIGPFAVHQAVTPGWTSRVTVTLVREGLALAHCPDVFLAARCAEFLADFDVWDKPNRELTKWARSIDMADILANNFGSRLIGNCEEDEDGDQSFDLTTY